MLDLLARAPEEAEARLKRTQSLEQVVAEPANAPTERELARSLAARPALDPAATLAAVGVRRCGRRAVLRRSLASVADADNAPGPLRVPAVLEALRERDVLSAGQLEGWLSCPYSWFVEHELRPQRLDPEGDPLWLGAVVHDAL